MYIVYNYDGEGYFSPYNFEGWKIAFLNPAERFTREGIIRLERHTKTDEVFVLLNGCATLLLGEQATEIDMIPQQLYVVKKNQWHNIIVSEDAKILIVENVDTGLENTEYMSITIGKS